ncbi:MAG TPA: hypothetical protein PLI43_01435 [Albidovulum sp.]|uniref:hypothetical protein n=1 Tax=Albidovulum sp. TaxID=1872424 RepID=UPI002C74B8F6|nr:hypothetical protein [Albidovulum sp.]
MATLAVLRHDEGIRVDAGRVAMICAGRSRREAEEILRRGIEGLVARVVRMQRHYDAADRAALVRSARFAGRMADQLGMTSFGIVAQDLIRATEAEDEPAAAATLARLLRIVNRSVSAIHDLRDMTM